MTMRAGQLTSKGRRLTVGLARGGDARGRGRDDHQQQQGVDVGLTGGQLTAPGNTVKLLTQKLSSVTGKQKTAYPHYTTAANNRSLRTVSEHNRCNRTIPR